MVGYVMMKPAVTVVRSYVLVETINRRVLQREHVTHVRVRWAMETKTTPASTEIVLLKLDTVGKKNKESVRETTGTL